jgi:FixJ family two-component response regulator
VNVIDDDDGFRNSMIRMLLAAGYPTSGYRCAGEFLIAHNEPSCGCILLDVSMPGPSGVELMRALAARDYSPAVIFITALDDLSTTVDVMKWGALDYLVKPVSGELVIRAVARALEIDARRRAKRQELQELRTRFETLTPIERAVFRGVVHNRLNKQLAADIGASERTIKVQRARIFQKLQVRSVPALVRMAKLLEDAGFVPSADHRPRVPSLRNATVIPARH